MMLVHRVVARNDATSSENKIHDDEVARRYGFGGGLVPGVTVYGYLTWAPARRWGAEWLEHGTITARFEKPVYDGDAVEVSADEGDDGAGLVLAARARGSVCATGTAALDDGAPQDGGASLFAPVPDPADRPPAGPDTLAPGTVLGTLVRRWDADDRAQYLDLLSDDLDLYDRLGVAHPGALIRAANSVLSSSVRLGPWIHVASATRLLGLVHDGAVVTTYGRVVDRFERKDHQFVDLDVRSVVDGRPVMAVRHTAIYEPHTVSPTSTTSPK
jgi:hypothetical protein